MLSSISAVETELWNSLLEDDKFAASLSKNAAANLGKMLAAHALQSCADRALAATADATADATAGTVDGAADADAAAPVGVTLLLPEEVDRGLGGSAKAAGSTLPARWEAAQREVS